MKLTKLFQNFQQKHLTNRSGLDFMTLRAALPQIFPDAEVVEELLTLLRPNPNDQRSAQLSVANLPVHTRDNAWLAQYIERTVNTNQANQVKLSDIQTFVAFDPEFDTERNRYERDVVRAEIQNMMIDPRTQSQIRANAYADEVFRDQVSQNMLNFGINQHSIEVSLEKNAHIWRRQTMLIAFANQCLPPIWDKGQVPFEQYVEVLSAHCDHGRALHEYADRWLAVREWKYYQDHQGIIDQLGTATPNMKLNPVQYAQQFDMER